MLARRKPRTVSRAERILLSVEYALLAVLIVTSLDQSLLTFGILLWPLLIIVAIVISIVIATTSSRIRER